MGGLAAYIADAVKNHIGAKVRGIELSLLQRCASHWASHTDIDESFRAGRAAVEYAVEGLTGKMVGFQRVYDQGGNYRCDIKLIDLEKVANKEKYVPIDWINATGDGLNEKFFDYALPLIQGTVNIPIEDGLPRHARLRMVKAMV